jgi:hypothetical protein
MATLMPARSLFLRLDRGGDGRTMNGPLSEEEVASMCYDDEYLRRLRAARESRELWRDFDRTRPVADPAPAREPDEAARAEIF